MKQLYFFLLFSFFSLALSAQSPHNRYISGIIEVEDSPLPGVNVVVKGTTRGTITDMEGRYYLEVSLGETVIFSFIGLDTREIKVDEDNSHPILPVVEEDRQEPGINWQSSLPESKEDKTFSPYIFVKSDNPAVDQLPLKSNHVNINIAGVIAQVQVRQTYINEGQNAIEAVYVFPGSTRSAVHSMVMQIGDRRIKAKIKEKEEAREIYESAKAEGKTASLLEQERPNVFTMNVANILPGDTVAVTMEYTELLVPEEGTYSFVYPTVVGPRFNGERADVAGKSTYAAQPYLPEGEQPTIDFYLTAQLNTAIPAKKVSSPSHQIQTQRLYKGVTQIKLDSTEIAGGNRDFILNYRLRGQQIESGLLVHEGENENFFLLMVEPPDRVESAAIPPREYIFVVDISGSMYGEPLDISKALMRSLLKELRPIDQFNILVFAGQSGWLNDKPLKANAINIDQSLQKLESINGGGGTYLLDALKKGMELSPDGNTVARSYVILTDGYVSVEREAMQYIRSHRHEANLFAIGIGSAPNRHIIEGMAYAGKAEPYFISNQDETAALSKRLNDAALYPLLSHARMIPQNMEVYDVEPFSLPDVMADRPLIIFGKYKNRDAGKLQITGTSGEGLFAQDYPLSAAVSQGNDALPLLWARERIRYLDDWAMQFEARTDEEVKAEVTQLGLRYNLLTQYTSFVAVDDRIRNTAPEESKQVNQPLPLPEGVSSLAIPGAHYSMLKMSQSASCLLYEVVVTGYGEAKAKQALAYSVTSINSNSIDPLRTLNGQVTGVNITASSGLAGAASTVQIRGNSSIASSGAPIYIVDGIVTEDISMVNPQDVQEINVLSNSAASALYGCRASNGIVVISTRKYAPGQRLNVNLSTGWNQANRLPERQSSFGQGTSGFAPGSSYSWGPQSTTGSSITPASLYRNGWHNSQAIDWKNDFEKDKVQLSFRRNQEGNILPDLSKTSYQSTFSWKRDLNRLRLETQGAANFLRGQDIMSSTPFDSYLAGVLLSPVGYDLQTQNAQGDFIAGGNLVGNPLQIARDQPLSKRSREYRLSAKAHYDLSSFLTWSNEWTGHWYSTKAEGGMASGLPAFAAGRAFAREESIQEYQLNSFLRSSLQAGDFGFESRVNGIFNIRSRDILRRDGETLLSAEDISLGNTITRSTWEAGSSHRKRGLLVEHQTDWRGYAYLTLTKHWKYSNSLPDGEGALGLEQVQVSILPENFIIMSNAFALKKVYGNLTTQELDAPFWQDASYRFAGTSLLADRWFMEPVRLEVNPDLSAAKAIHWEAGTDMRIGDRFSLDINYKKQKTTDFYLPIATGTGTQIVNAGTLLRSEWKLNLEGFLRTYDDFRWKPSLQVSIPRNEMSGLERSYVLGGTDIAQTVAQNGAPLGAIYGSRWARDAQGRQVIGADGFPLVAATPGLIGNPVPDMLISSGHELNYRSLSLQMNWLWIKGGDIWNGTRAMMDYFGTSTETADLRNSTRVFEGVLSDGSTNSQAVALADPAQGINSYYWLRNGLGGVAEDYIEDGSSLRLSELTLGWYLPINIGRALKLHEGKVSFTAYNLLVFSDYRGIDPRAVQGGLDLFNQPNTRSYQVNLRLTF